jgi:putative two-component system response regulator
MSPASTPLTASSQPPRPRTALIVDDFPSVRFYHAHLLERAGFKCSVATNGREALKMLQKETVDLIVLDIVMPEMNGEELIASLRASAALARVPVLVISTEPLRERLERKRTTTSGPVGFAQKPLMPGTIWAEIEGLFQ